MPVVVFRELFRLARRKSIGRAQRNQSPRPKSSEVDE